MGILRNAFYYCSNCKKCFLTFIQFKRYTKRIMDWRFTPILAKIFFSGFFRYYRTLVFFKGMRVPQQYFKRKYDYDIGTIL